MTQGAGIVGFNPVKDGLTKRNGATILTWNTPLNTINPLTPIYGGYTLDVYAVSATSALNGAEARLKRSLTATGFKADKVRDRIITVYATHTLSAKHDYPNGVYNSTFYLDKSLSPDMLKVEKAYRYDDVLATEDVFWQFYLPKNATGITVNIAEDAYIYGLRINGNLSASGSATLTANITKVTLQ